MLEKYANPIVVSRNWTCLAGTQVGQAFTRLNSRVLHEGQTQLNRLDQLFPFIVLGYGALLTIALNSPSLWQIARQKLPANLLALLASHRLIGWVCLGVGGIWSLQNLWLG